MNGLLVVLYCYALSSVLGQSEKEFDLETCRLQLSCGSETQNVQPVGGVTGRPGKSGPPGSQGPPGPMGQKGDKGDNCDCKGGLNDVKGRFDGEKDCPQTKFVFPTKNQVNDWIRINVPLQEFTEATVCAWISSNDDETPVSGAYLSYAVSAQANEFLLYFVNQNLEVFMKGQAKSINLKITTRSHICVVVAPSKGVATVFRNGEFYVKLVYSDKSPIVGGGALLIGQEQDQMFGGFVAGEAFHGILENLMLWYSAIDGSEVKSMYNNPCSCPVGYSVALTPSQIQLEGKVRPLPVKQC